jgi:hypothetical protein
MLHLSKENQIATQLIKKITDNEMVNVLTGDVKVNIPEDLKELNTNFNKFKEKIDKKKIKKEQILLNEEKLINLEVKKEDKESVKKAKKEIKNEIKKENKKEKEINKDNLKKEKDNKDKDKETLKKENKKDNNKDKDNKKNKKN